jgi:hypothetical protein
VCAAVHCPSVRAKACCSAFAGGSAKQHQRGRPFQGLIAKLQTYSESERASWWAAGPLGVGWGGVRYLVWRGGGSDAFPSISDLSPRPCRCWLEDGWMDGWLAVGSLVVSWLGSMLHVHVHDAPAARGFHRPSAGWSSNGQVSGYYCGVAHNLHNT